MPDCLYFQAKRGWCSVRMMLVAFFVAGLAFAPASQAQPRGIPLRVLIISSDGLRPDAIEKTSTPNLDRLIANGSYTPTCQAQFPCITLPNHCSMTTGLSIPHHGVTANIKLDGRIGKTTIFDVAAKAGMTVGFFHNKDKLGYLCPPDVATVWKFSPDVDLLAEQVVAAIAAEDMRLMFVHFGEPDGSGHRVGWLSDAYLEQVTRVDRAIGWILDALEKKGVLSKTIVIMTADHGGHDKTHFLPLPFDQNIPWIANGPGIKQGFRIEDKLNTVDTAATALHILELPLESASDGKPVAAAFVDFRQKEAEPVATTQPADTSISCGPFVWLALVVVPVIALLAWKGREPKPKQARQSAEDDATSDSEDAENDAI